MISKQKPAQMQTEKEKMLLGLMFNGRDPELHKDRIRVSTLQKKFNNMPADVSYDERHELLCQMFGSFGSSFIREPIYLDYGSNVFIGNGCYFNFGCTILDAGGVHIGNNVLFGPNVSLYSVNHPLDPEDRKGPKQYGKPIDIQDDVWICGSATVIEGVTIGKGSVVAAGSVVIKDIPEKVLFGGNPAKFIKHL